MTQTEGAATPSEGGPQMPTELEYANMRATDAERRAMRMEEQLERVTNLQDLLTQAGQVLSDLDCWQEVNACARTQTAAENALREARTGDLLFAKERLHEAETAALLDVYGAVAGGKKAEQRKAQIDAYLVQNEAVRAAREHLHVVEARVTSLEAALAMAKTDHRIALLHWNSARAKAGLFSAMLVAAAGRG